MAEHHIPNLSSICRKPVVVGVDRPVQTLINLFQSNPGTSAVPICGPDGFLGCVYLKAFRAFLGRPFAEDLYARKPIATILESVLGPRLVFSPETDINTAARTLLSADPMLEIASFPLLQGELCVGVVEVADLMLAVVTEHRRLLDTLVR